MVACSKTPSKGMLRHYGSLGQHSINPFGCCYAHWKPKLATHLDLFLDQRLHSLT